MGRLWTPLFCCALVLCALACMRGDAEDEVGGAGQNVTNDSKALAKQFGDFVIAGDWTSAYAMTTPAFQSTTPVGDLQKQYNEILAQLRQGEPSFTPDKTEVDQGEMPVDESQAARYGVKTVPPKSTWKAWMFATLLGNDAQGRAMGMEVRLFVVSDNGQDKFAHVYFDHIN